MVDTAGIALAFPLIVQHARWLDAFLVEGSRYGMEAHAGGSHSKDPAHGGCRVLVNDRPAKASAQVKAGDVLEIQFGSKSVRVEVLNVQETVKKEEAQELYRYL